MSHIDAHIEFCIISEQTIHKVDIFQGKKQFFIS